MEKSLTVDAYLNGERWEQMQKIADALVQSKAFPKHIQNGPQAMVVMQAGVEMGMKPLEAINGLTIINGVVTPWGKATVRLLRNHGWKIAYETLMDRGGGIRATVSKDDEEYTEELYFDQAVKSGWTKSHDGNLKFSWKEGVNRLLKLRYGVLSIIIKTYLPEVLGSAGDIAEVAEDYIIEEIDEAPPAPPTTTVAPDDRKKGLAEHLAEQEKAKEEAKTAEKMLDKAETNKKSSKTAEKVEKPTEHEKDGAQEAEVVND